MQSSPKSSAVQPDSVDARLRAGTRRLILIRHAKAVEDDLAGDHARGLSERGVADAASLGEWLKAQGLVPDMALCSTATRTRQTLAAIQGCLGQPVIPAQAGISGEVIAGGKRDSRLRGNDDYSYLRIHIPTILSDKLYLASPNDMLSQIQATDDAVETLMVVAHNPGCHALVAMLVGEYANEADADRILLKFPTSACAVMEFVVGGWKDVVGESGRLAGFR